MANRSDVVVVIPAYQPDEKLLHLVELIRLRCMVLVVDDGSTKGLEILESVGRKVDVLLRHHENKGKGAALKTAFRYVFEHYPQAPGVVTADSDGQHRPEDIMRVAQEMLQHASGITLGVRAFSAGTPFRSRLGNFSTRILFWLLTGLHIKDTQTGLRGIPRSLLPRVSDLPGDRYEYEMKMLVDSKYHTEKPTQIDIDTIYIEENKSSHFNPIVDSLKIWAVLFHFCFSSVLAFIIDNVVFYIGLLCLRQAIERMSIAIMFALVVARVVSANFQYIYNCRITFSSRQLLRNYVKYWVLVVIIGVLSYFGTNILVYLTGFENGFVITLLKIFVETMLFVLSYICQKFWVFREVCE